MHKKDARLIARGMGRPYRHYKSSPCRGYRYIGGKVIYARSLWEANYARYLEWQKSLGHIKGWEHEPKRFPFEAIKRGTTSYLPDFKVTRHDGSHGWIEVKGKMDAKSATQIKRFRKYYPEESLSVVCKVIYKDIEKSCAPHIPDWETRKNMRIISKAEADKIKKQLKEQTNATI